VTVRRMAALLAVTGGLVLAACGISPDDQPRALPIPPTTTAPAAPTTTGGTASAVLWFVSDQDLVPASRALTDRSLGTAIGALLEPGASLEGGLSNSIPAGTELLELGQDGGVLTIDLGGSFQELAGTARLLAIGQLVLTATEDRQVEEVRFLVDGEPILAGSPERGDVASVTACDFAPLLPSAEEAAAAPLSSATVERLDQRRTELERDCSSS